MQSKTMRHYFLMAIVAEQKILQELQNFCDCSQKLEEFFRKKYKRFIRIPKSINEEIWTPPLDLVHFYRAVILKSIFHKFLKKELLSDLNFMFLLIDRYGWHVSQVAWITNKKISDIETGIKHSRLKLLNKEKNFELVEKTCFLFRPKVISWDLGTLQKPNDTFMEHYKSCTKCQAEFAAYQEAKELIRENFPFQVDIHKKKNSTIIKENRIYFVYSILFVLFFTGVVVSTLPQLKLIWELKSIKSIRYYEDAQSQVTHAVESSIEQLSNVESKVLFPELPKSELVIQNFEKSNPNQVPKWLNTQLKSNVTRLFAHSKDLNLVKNELESMIMDFKLKPLAGSTTGVEEKPNGILLDILVPKQKYPDFKNKLNRLSSLIGLEENQYKNWDSTNTRVMLWIQKQF